MRQWGTMAEAAMAVERVGAAAGMVRDAVAVAMAGESSHSMPGSRRPGSAGTYYPPTL